MEKNTEKKRWSEPSGWDKKKKKEVEDRAKESSKYAKLDAYFSFSTTSAAPDENLSMNLGTDNNTRAPDAATDQQVEPEFTKNLITSTDSHMKDEGDTVRVRLQFSIKLNYVLQL